MVKNRKRLHHVGFNHAWDGLVHAFKFHGNFWIHTFVSVIVVGLGFYFHLVVLKWLFLVLVIIMVYVAELLNTSIEAVVDLVTEEWRENAKIAKDVSSTAVLVAALGAVVVGLLIFLPEFF